MQGIKKCLRWQMVVALLISALCLVLGKQQALSALLGAFAALLPSLIFFKVFFKHQGAQAARQIVTNFYLGEGLKLLSGICCCALVFLLYKNLSPVAFFATYVMMLMMHWLSPLMIAKN